MLYFTSTVRLSLRLGGAGVGWGGAGGHFHVRGFECAKITVHRFESCSSMYFSFFLFLFLCLFGCFSLFFLYSFLFFFFQAFRCLSTGRGLVPMPSFPKNAGIVKLLMPSETGRRPRSSVLSSAGNA